MGDARDRKVASSREAVLLARRCRRTLVTHTFRISENRSRWRAHTLAWENARRLPCRPDAGQRETTGDAPAWSSGHSFVMTYPCLTRKCVSKSTRSGVRGVSNPSRTRCLASGGDTITHEDGLIKQPVQFGLVTCMGAELVGANGNAVGDGSEAEWSVVAEGVAEQKARVDNLVESVGALALQMQDLAEGQRELTALAMRLAAQLSCGRQPMASSRRV